MLVRLRAAVGHYKALFHVAPCIHIDRVHVINEIQFYQETSQSPYRQNEENSITPMCFHAHCTVCIQTYDFQINYYVKVGVELALQLSE